MAIVDYNQHQHRVFRQARELPPETVAGLMNWLHQHLGDVEGQPVLDLGSGTGRFSGEIADRLRTQVFALEPSYGMRAEAKRAADNRRVLLVGGRAEELPFSDRFFRAAFALNVMHHVSDRPAAAHELARVVVTEGTLVVTGSIADDYHQRLMSRWFPSYPAIANEVCPTAEELQRDLAAGGWTLRIAEQLEHSLAEDLSAYAERIALRGQSLLELLPDDEFEEGVRRMREDARNEHGRVIDHYDCFVFRQARNR